MSRRFLNLLTECRTTGMYSLHRIEPLKHLFYRTTNGAKRAMSRTEAAIKAYAKEHDGKHPGLAFMASLGPMPPARINFQPSPLDQWRPRGLEFAALLGDENRIIIGDETGDTAIYDAERHSVITSPPLRSNKGPAALAINIPCPPGDPPKGLNCLYVMSLVPKVMFRDLIVEVLRYGSKELEPRYRLVVPHWTRLSAPTFINNPANELSEICSSAVVDGTIYISTFNKNVGTYALETVKCSWSRLANWVLPFFGKAEFVPELKFWFAITAHYPYTYSLCACDLSRASFLEAPTVRYTWPNMDIPQGWRPSQGFVIHLGSGKLCIVMIFHSSRPYDPADDEEIYPGVFPSKVHEDPFAVFTAVEVVRNDDGEVEMVKHKSKVLTLDTHSIQWVL